MKLIDQTRQRLRQRGERVLSTAFRYAKRVPFVRARLEAEYASMLEGMRESAKPYRDRLERVTRLPEQGRARQDILDEIDTLQSEEASRWRDGYVSGAVYHGDNEHIDFLNQIYARCSQANPLHADLWPSVVKYEAEIVAMTGHMLGSAHVGEDDEVCGAVSSGGTESIMLAMKTYRDYARDKRGIRNPQMVVPTTAHAAFDKASRYFGIEMVKVPVGPDFRADVAATRKALTKNTAVVVGSTPAFPHGVIDPIESLSELARSRGIGFHVDACLGGFVLPWATDLGYPVPKFDFRLPGVTSISADTHKYGYAAKGTSVVLYRSPELRRFQWYTTTDWPGGLYLSPTFAGSRPGALSAACWAAMVSIGADGYRAATKKILETAATVRAGIEQIDGLKVLGDPLWVIAFASDDLDIYRILDFMTHRRWNLNGLHRPACVHLCVTLRHTQEGVAERFLSDLRDAVAHVKTQPKSEGGMAPIYGLAGTLPVRGAISDVLERYLDVLYEV
ncbi:MAG: aminotransferase class V-fold PLP-dependent enzyme [Myxococcota bacterium]